MAWLYLLGAGLCEMAWPLGFKYSDGFTKNSTVIYGTLGIMICSFWLMSCAIREGIPMGTTYAVWTGIGAVGTATLGILLFNEPRELPRIVCLGVVIVGLVGLNLLSPLERTTATGSAATTEQR
jgi:quaternary ammonium compound-resistance protein SugE